MDLGSRRLLASICWERLHTPSCAPHLPPLQRKHLGGDSDDDDDEEELQHGPPLQPATGGDGDDGGVDALAPELAPAVPAVAEPTPPALPPPPKPPRAARKPQPASDDPIAYAPLQVLLPGGAWAQEGTPEADSAVAASSQAVGGGAQGVQGAEAAAAGAVRLPRCLPAEVGFSGTGTAEEGGGGGGGGRVLGMPKRPAWRGVVRTADELHALEERAFDAWRQVGTRAAPGRRNGLAACGRALESACVACACCACCAGGAVGGRARSRELLRGPARVLEAALARAGPLPPGAHDRRRQVRARARLPPPRPPPHPVPLIRPT